MYNCIIHISINCQNIWFTYNASGIGFKYFICNLWINFHSCPLEVGAIVGVITQVSKLKHRETCPKSPRGTNPGLPDNRAHGVGGGHGEEVTAG